MISAHYLLTLVSIQLAVIQVVTFWYYSRPPKSDILTFFNFKGIFKSFLWLRKIWNFSFLRDEVVWHNCGRIKISEIANMLCLLDQTCEEGGTTATKLCYAWRVKTRVLLQSGFWKSHTRHCETFNGPSKYSEFLKNGASMPASRIFSIILYTPQLSYTVHFFKRNSFRSLALQ